MGEYEGFTLHTAVAKLIDPAAFGSDDPGGGATEQEVAIFVAMQEKRRTDARMKAHEIVELVRADLQKPANR